MTIQKLTGLSPLNGLRTNSTPSLPKDPVETFEAGRDGGDDDGAGWGTLVGGLVGVAAAAGVGYVTYTAAQNQPPVVQQQPARAETSHRVPRPTEQIRQQTEVQSAPIHQAPQPIYQSTPQPVSPNGRTTVDTDGVVTMPLGQNTTIDTEGRIETRVGNRTSIRSDGTVNFQVSPNVSIRSDGTVSTRVSPNMSIRSDGTLEWHFGGH